MSRRGVNPKRWFYELRSELQKRPEVLAGAASEQWLNAELFRVVARGLGQRLTAAPEVGKSDVVIAALGDDGADWDNPAAIIEVKLVYRSYSEAKIRTYIRRLIEQMREARKRTPQSYGFLYAVYNVWEDRSTALTFADFRKRVLTILRDEAKGVQLARRTLETFIDECPQKIGGMTVSLGVAAQYLFV